MTNSKATKQEILDIIETIEGLIGQVDFHSARSVELRNERTSWIVELHQAV